MLNHPNYHLYETLIKSKKHLIWDWNGTLLDDIDHAISTINAILCEHQLPQINRDSYKEHFDFPIRKYYEKLGFDFAKLSFEDICHQFVDDYMAGLHRCQMVTGLRDFLQMTKTRASVQSILSATDQENLNKIVAHFKLENLFHHAFGIDNKFADSKIKRGKELMDTVGIAPHETLLFGDTLHDLEVGKELNIDVILLSHGHQSYDRLAAAHANVL